MTKPTKKPWFRHPVWDIGGMFVFSAAAYMSALAAIDTGSLIIYLVTMFWAVLAIRAITSVARWTFRKSATPHDSKK